MHISPPGTGTIVSVPVLEQAVVFFNEAMVPTPFVSAWQLAVNRRAFIAMRGIEDQATTNRHTMTQQLAASCFSIPFGGGLERYLDIVFVALMCYSGLPFG
jgi:hypothetical protein